MVRVAVIRSVLLLCVLSVGLRAHGTVAATISNVPQGWPKLVSIPVIGVKAPVESLSLSRLSDAEAPYKWGDVAWYNRSARPGDRVTSLPGPCRRV